MKAFMSIDVEDWFHTANFQNILTREEWEHQTTRVEHNTHKILDIFDTVGVKSTFFVLGWVAKKYPLLVPEIAKRGHEVASHGTHHELVYKMAPEDFRDDIRYSKKILEEQSGNEVLGYRASNFSITDQAIDILQEEGFRYDSSVFPTVFHDRYGGVITTDSIRVDMDGGRIILAQQGTEYYKTNKKNWETELKFIKK